VHASKRPSEQISRSTVAYGNRKPTSEPTNIKPKKEAAGNELPEQWREIDYQEKGKNDDTAT
jgi:hypothetical protein